MVYYNEWEPFLCGWLRELIKEGLIPDGEVDGRDIRDVQPSDLRGFQQCHFFAGIGGWAHALNLAGWGDRAVFTGSCPCQPFSHAGNERGTEDERHLFPEWMRLIRECRPPAIFGEQVENAIKLGWWDTVHRELEAENYACGMAVLGAHSSGAPHLRQRLYFAARSLGDAAGARLGEQRETASTEVQGSIAERAGGVAETGDAGIVAGELRDWVALCGETSGQTPSQSYAETGIPDSFRLNPAFSLWLMGYPATGWTCCGVQVTR